MSVLVVSRPKGDDRGAPGQRAVVETHLSDDAGGGVGGQGIEPQGHLDTVEQPVAISVAEERIGAESELVAVGQEVVVGVALQGIGTRFSKHLDAVAEAVAVGVVGKDLGAALEFVEIVEAVAVGIFEGVVGVVRIEALGDFEFVGQAVVVGVVGNQYLDLDRSQHPLIARRDKHPPTLEGHPPARRRTRRRCYG